MISCWFFVGSCFELTCYDVFVTGFFLLLFWLCHFLKNQIVWFGFVLSFDFLVFYTFFFRLINSLQKKKLSSS